MTRILAEGTLLKASADDRTLTYRLLPFGEPGRTNIGKVIVDKGVLTVPEDPTTLVANLEHDGTRPVAKFVSVEETDEGLNATVRVLATSAGNDLLTEAAEGVRTGISVEVDNIVVRAGRMLSGLLTGAGFVTQPAFASAHLIAADAGDLPEDSETVVVNGVTYQRVPNQNPEAPEVSDQDPSTEDESTDADQSAESEENVSTALTAAAPAAAPQGLHAPAPGNKDKSANEVFRMVASAYKSGSESKMLAALTNIVHDDGDGDGLGEITSAPGWLGEVWSAIPYQRKWIPLISTGTLTSFREKGFHFGTLPLVQKYAGNKAEVPSNGMTATPIDYVTQRWAHAADLDRRFVDFGDSEVLRAFVEAQMESYRRETDKDVHDGLFTMAATFTPDTVPTGVDAGLAALIDGALTLVNNDLNPTFAIVGSGLYRNLLFTLEQKGLKFLTMALGMEEGSLDGFQIRPSGRTAATDKVLVGDGSTVVFKEFGGGSPVRVEAEHVSHGGRDLGLFGYTSLQDRTPASVNGVVVADLAPAE